jgi:hypothetical protein
MTVFRERLVEALDELISVLEKHGPQHSSCAMGARRRTKRADDGCCLQCFKFVYVLAFVFSVAIALTGNTSKGLAIGAKVYAPPPFG